MSQWARKLPVEDSEWKEAREGPKSWSRSQEQKNDPFHISSLFCEIGGGALIDYLNRSEFSVCVWGGGLSGSFIDLISTWPLWHLLPSGHR